MFDKKVEKLGDDVKKAMDIVGKAGGPASCVADAGDASVPERLPAEKHDDTESLEVLRNDTSGALEAVDSDEELDFGLGDFVRLEGSKDHRSKKTARCGRQATRCLGKSGHHPTRDLKADRDQAL